MKGEMHSGKARSALLSDCLRRNRMALLLLLLTFLTGIAIFYLYDLPREPLLYAGLLLLVFALILFALELLPAQRRAAARKRNLAGILAEWNRLGSPASAEEADYQEMLRRLGTTMEELTARYAAERLDMCDYYTTWVHQIKTPIAVMKLNLSDDTEEGRALSAELFRIEQYVEMVLSYIRLEGETNDLVIREYVLDDLIREVLRKYASQFILRHLKLSYEPTDLRIVTDQKWFCSILEQLISNAVKYTPEGTITIRVEKGAYADSKTSPTIPPASDGGYESLLSCISDRGASEYLLSVSDTGIGIAPEDLPRIFEKGYTGINGRLDRRSSGIGLYLCKKAADKLALSLHVESTPGEGSRFCIGFHTGFL